MPDALSFGLSPTGESNRALNEYIQPNFGHALRIWWAYYWPTTLITFVFGVFLGLIVRILYQNVVVSPRILIPVSKYGSYVINYVVALFIMRYVLGKNFRLFRLALVSNSDPAPTEELKITFGRTLRVWWIFTWRTVVYTILSFVFVMYPMGMFVGLFRPSPLFSSLFFLLFGTAVSGALSLFVIYSNLLEEEIGDFRIILRPREKQAPAQSVLPTSDPAPLG